MKQHSDISLAIGKPLLLEELGTGVIANQPLSLLQSQISTKRTPFMEMVYGQFNQSLQTGGIWRGEICLCNVLKEDAFVMPLPRMSL